MYLAIALAGVSVAVCAPFLEHAAFGTYFGAIPPTLAVICVALCGTLALRRLSHVTWAGPPESWAWTLRALAVGAGFALPMIAVDVTIGFPADINVPMPDALAFYLVMGFVAETVFHLVPLAVFTLSARIGFGMAAMAVALVEPMFQIAFADQFGLREVFMSLVLIAFGYAQVMALRRGGFASAFAMRIGYYLVWHIVWGMARLPYLFAT